MQRLALSLALMGAALLACSAATALPSRAMAFELDTGAATVPGGTAQFYDPDEAPLPAPLPSARTRGGWDEPSDGARDRDEPSDSAWDEPSDSAHWEGQRQPGRQQGFDTEPVRETPFWTYSGAAADRLR